MPTNSQLPASAPVHIREFRPGDEVAFRRLNEEWITRYFRLEEKDIEALTNPASSILAPGGRIFLAVMNEVCVGCCALLYRTAEEFEVAKMAVTPSAQGLGIGRKLLATTIDYARHSGINRLYLETNHQLTPAIRLYESQGFRRLDPASITPSPYARADVYMELLLTK